MTHFPTSLPTPPTTDFPGEDTPEGFGETTGAGQTPTTDDSGLAEVRQHVDRCLEGLTEGLQQHLGLSRQEAEEHVAEGIAPRFHSMLEQAVYLGIRGEREPVLREIKSLIHDVSDVTKQIRRHAEHVFRKHHPHITKAERARRLRRLPIHILLEILTESRYRPIPSPRPSAPLSPAESNTDFPAPGEPGTLPSVDRDRPRA